MPQFCLMAWNMGLMILSIDIVKIVRGLNMVRNGLRVWEKSVLTGGITGWAGLIAWLTVSDGSLIFCGG